MTEINRAAQIANMGADVVSVLDFGAVGDYDPGADSGTDDTAAFKAAITAAQGVDGEYKRAVFVPAGKYLISDTLYLENGMHIYGEGHNIYTVLSASRLYAKPGMEKDLLRVKGYTTATGLIGASIHIHNIDLRGDDNGTLGRALAFVDDSGDDVTPIDQTKIYDMCIKEFPQSGIYLPRGIIPLHIRDIRITETGLAGSGFGVEYVGGSQLTASLTLDNISGDDNYDGLIGLKDLDPSSNVVIINAKSENRLVDQQKYVVVCDNCDRASIDIVGGHVTRRSDHPTEQAPRDFIRITGAGVPIVTWSAIAPRVFVPSGGITISQQEIDTSYVLHDTLSGRGITYDQRSGDYNSVNARRVSQTAAQILNNGGSDANIPMNTVDALFDGDITVAAQLEDMGEVFCGEAVFDGDSDNQYIYFRRQNKSGSTWTPSGGVGNPTLLQGFRVPKSWTRASGISAAYTPDDGGGHVSGSTTLLKTVAVPGAALGDFCLITHPARQHSCVITSYVDSAGSVTAAWFAFGTDKEPAQADLNAYILREDKINILGTYSYDPSSLANSLQETTEYTLEGAAIGDVIVTSFSIDLQGILVSAYVSAANTIKVVFLNYTGGTLDLGAGTLRIGVLTR